VLSDPSGQSILTSCLYGAAFGALLGGAFRSMWGNPEEALASRLGKGALYGSVAGMFGGLAFGFAYASLSGYGIVMQLAVAGGAGGGTGTFSASYIETRDLKRAAVDSAVATVLGAVAGPTLYFGGRAAGHLARRATQALSRQFPFLNRMHPRQLISTHRIRITRGKPASEYQKLKADIRRSGVREPIKYVRTSDGRNYIVDGHHRARAAQELGLQSVPVEEVTLPYRGYRTEHDLYNYFGN